MSHFLRDHCDSAVADLTHLAPQVPLFRVRELGAILAVSAYSGIHFDSAQISGYQVSGTGFQVYLDNLHGAINSA